MFEDKLRSEDMESLFLDVELPLASVLADMEITGVHVDKNTLDVMGEEFKVKMEGIYHEKNNCNRRRLRYVKGRKRCH